MLVFLKYIKSSLHNSYLRLIRRYQIRNLNKKRKVLIEGLKGKDKINVVFFALFDSIWKCDSLYRKMLEDARFNPIILICPVINFDCASFFEKKGYPYLMSYNKNTNEYLDVKKVLSPDIIIYTNPYKGLIHDNYYLDKFDDVLTCYIPYFYESGNEDMFFNLDFHNYIWRYYVESDALKQEQEKKIGYHRKNVVPVGFCSFDEFKTLGNKFSEDHSYKTIIWAPHHLIDGTTYVRDSFFKYHELFFELADKYEGRVRFIFRPHPLLKNKLEKVNFWGVEKTKDYYNKWSNHQFCSIEENCSYIELFRKSDAMIHDCGSFITEYLYENKPALFTGNDDFSPKIYWHSAIEAISCYYRADSVEEIVKFVDDVVNEKNDSKKQKRELFIKDNLHPEYDVAQNIIDDILDSIDNQILYRN